MATQNNPPRLSRRFRLGALALLFLLLAFVVSWRLMPLFHHTQPVRDPELQLAWEKFDKEQLKPAEKKPDYHARRSYHAAEQVTIPVKLSPFDPNTASEQELVALGLPGYTVRTWIKYRSKGGHFRKTEDLQRLYTLRHEDYERIAPYVRIAAESTVPSGYRPAGTTAMDKAPALIELNGADAGALMSLRGIGPGYSRRILNYREALGGFFSVEQLKEVYGFPDSTYQQLKDRFTVDGQKVRLLNINEATEEMLAQHPYIGKKMAANIIKLRNDVKTFSEIVQLRQVPLINEEKYRKIAPYLSTH